MLQSSQFILFIFQIACLRLLQNKSCGWREFSQEAGRRQQIAGSFLNICHCRILRNWGPIDSQPWLIFRKPCFIMSYIPKLPSHKKILSPWPGVDGSGCQPSINPLIRPIGYFLMWTETRGHILLCHNNSTAVACGEAAWLRPLMSINAAWRRGFVPGWKWTQKTEKEGEKPTSPSF